MTEDTVLDRVQGPLTGLQRADLHAIREMAGPLTGEQMTDVARIIKAMTTSTPPVLHRLQISPDTALAPLVAATVLTDMAPQQRVYRAARIVSALQLEPDMAGPLITYAQHPLVPTTVLHHLVHHHTSCYNPVVEVIEAVLYGILTGAVATNERGAQIYQVDSRTLFMAYPKTCERADIAPEGGLAHLQDAGMATSLHRLTLSLEDEKPYTLCGFLTPFEVWQSYAQHGVTWQQPLALAAETGMTVEFQVASS